MPETAKCIGWRRRAPIDRRTHVHGIKSHNQSQEDADIEEIHFQLCLDRAAQIRQAVFAALNEHENASLPKNPFRKDDTEGSAFLVAVAADQHGDLLFISNPPKFTSVTRDREQYMTADTAGNMRLDPKLFCSTADPEYCATLRRAIKALMTGKKIASQPPEPIQLELCLPPGTPFVPPQKPHAEPAPKTAPPVPGQRPPLGAEEWWTAPAKDDDDPAWANFDK